MKKVLGTLLLSVGLFSSLAAHRYGYHYQTYYPEYYSYPVVYREPVCIEFVRPVYVQPKCDCACRCRSYPRARYRFSWGFSF